LYYEDRKFHLLSSPLLVVGPDNTVLIVGHDGDSLAHTMPVSIKASNAVLDVLALVFPLIVRTAALENLMAHNTIIDLIANKEPFPFPVTEEGDAALVFVGIHVARIPLLIPLPMGHAMDSVALDNTEGIDEMIAKLMAISPTYAKWAQSMVYTGKHFDNKSLSVETLAVPEIYFDGIHFTALLCGSINTKSSRVDVTSTKSKAVLTRIKAAKKTNMETWLLSAITSRSTPSCTLCPRPFHRRRSSIRRRVLTSKKKVVCSRVLFAISAGFSSICNEKY
jgi:hypothetical protein